MGFINLIPFFIKILKYNKFGGILMIISQEYINKLLGLPADFLITRWLLEISEDDKVQYDLHGIRGTYVQDDKQPRTKIIEKKIED